MWRFLSNSLDVDEILNQTLTRVMAYLGVEAGEIFLVEEGTNELRLALHRGEAAEAFWTMDHFQIGEGFIGIVAETGKPMVTMTPQQDMRYLRRAVVDAGFRCIACIPMMARGNMVGVMGVATRRERHLDQREIHLLTAIGTWLITIENAHINRQARRLAVLEARPDRHGLRWDYPVHYGGAGADYARLAVGIRLARSKIGNPSRG
jgi:GAF domain-containing protein